MPKKTEVTFLVLLLTSSLGYLIWKSLSLPLELDELGSYWVIKDSLSLCFSRSIEIQGQSPLFYSMLWIVKLILGDSQLSLRLLSIFSIIISAILIYKISTILFYRIAGLYSALAFLLSLECMAILFSARPYGMAMMLMLASTYFLIIWILSQKYFHLASYIILQTLTIYCHYIFIIALPFHLIVLAILAHKYQIELQKKLFRQYAAGIFCLAIFLFPCTYQMKLLAEKSPYLSFMHIPDISNIAATSLTHVQLDLVLIFLAIFLIFKVAMNLALMPCLNKLLKGKLSEIQVVAIWFIMPPILIGLLSICFNRSIWLERYYVMRLGGIAILSGIFLSQIRPWHNRIIAALVFITGTIYYYRDIYPFNTDVVYEGFSAASQVIRNDKEYGSCSIILQSGFIESSNMAFMNQQTVSDFLKSPAYYYLRNTSPIILPYTLEVAGGNDYFKNKLEPVLNDTACFWLIDRVNTLKINGKDYQRSVLFLRNRASDLYFENTYKRTFGTTELSLYKKHPIRN